MPAKSKAQFRYFEACKHNPKHTSGCPSPKVVNEFVGGHTKQPKGLPSKVKKKG